jgi:hypothetical protein
MDAQSDNTKRHPGEVNSQIDPDVERRLRTSSNPQHGGKAIDAINLIWRLEALSHQRTPEQPIPH